MIDLTVTDEVALVRMAHGKVNALDAELLTALTDTFTNLKSRDDVRAVVLTGTKSVFSAGADLPRVLAESPEYVAEGIARLGDAFMVLYTFPKPVVAALNGHAIAGGCVISCAADHRVMARGGTIGLAELRVGVPFPYAGLEIVRACVGDRNVQELVYFGRAYDADEARARGLVDVVVDAEELTAHALGAARTLAQVPPTTFALTKRSIRQPVVDRVDTHAAKIDTAVAAQWASDEVRASMTAFMESLAASRRA